MNLHHLTKWLALVCFSILVLPGIAYGVETETYCLVETTMRGPVGTIIGFLFALSGFVMIFIRGSWMGVLFILIGISVTALPGFYKSTLGSLTKVFSAETVNTASDFEVSCPE